MDDSGLSGLSEQKVTCKECRYFRTADEYLDEVETVPEHVMDQLNHGECFADGGFGLCVHGGHISGEFVIHDPDARFKESYCKWFTYINTYPIEMVSRDQDDKK